MVKEKHIVISEETHAEVMKLKAELRNKTQDETIRYLLMESDKCAESNYLNNQNEKGGE